jgi:uncharacterized protein YjbI with pentapeptide repeats
MRVVKSLHQGLLSAPFTFRQQHRLGVATLIAFELGTSEGLLTEQQLWQRLLPVLESEGDLVLDVALPKEQGEWLLYGAACSLMTRPTIRVSAAVAGIEKSLEVYGPRDWLASGRASEPRTFQRQPLRWQSTFGGAKIPDNPQGGGQQQPAAIFYPQQQQIYRDQRVTPAGFLPLAFDHPNRVCYQGRYDEIWRRDHWPGYPPDLDWRYFNVAPLDQRLPGFFQVGDPYHLVNLHPEQSQIGGRLPSHRPRAFIEYHTGQLAELSLRCDTVWLFSEQLLGVMIYHGVAPIEEDEALDVKQILLGLEAADSVPLTAADYLAQSQYDAVEAEMDPPLAAEAAAHMAQAEKTIADIPKLLQFKKDQISGQAPKPQASLLEQQGIVQQQLEGHLVRLAETKEWLATQPVSAEVRASVENGCAQLVKMQQRLGELPAQLSEITQQVHDAGQQLQQAVPESFNLPLKPVEQLLVKLANFTALEKSWQAQAGRLVSLAQHGMTAASPQAVLQALGLRLLTQQRYLPGYLPNAIPFIPEAWALVEPAEREVIGPGWLLPEFQGATFTALTVRPGPLQDPTGEYRIQGSQPGPWCSGQHPGWATVIVPELVLGWRLSQDVDHLVDVLLLATPETELALAILQGLQQAPLILVPLTAEQSIEPWQQHYPRAQPLWMGDYADLQARLDAGVDQCQWLKSMLPQALIPRAIPEPDPVALMEATVKHIGDQIGVADPLAIEALLQQQLQEFQQQVAMLPESAQALINPALQNFKFTVPSSTPLEQLQTAKVQVEQAFSELKQLASRHPDAPAMPALEPFQQQIQALMQQAEQLLSEGMAQLPKPDEQPQHDYRPLNREQVVAAYQAGDSLVRVNLSGVDLSGLSLPGIDLTESILNKSNFANSDLSDAQLVGIIANHACFTGAGLQRANLHQALLSEADLSGIRGAGCRMTEALLKGALLPGADLSGAQLAEMMAEGAQFQQASLRQADLTEAILLGADLTKADLTEARVPRVIANEAKLSNSCWVGTVGESANLWGVEATEADFSRAQLPNARFGPACLTRAKLCEAELSEINLMHAQAQQADFSSSNLRQAYMNHTNLQQANLQEVNLRHSQLLRSDLEGARLQGADCLQASLLKSRLVGADCRQANFFNADLRKVVVGETQFAGANLRRTLLKHYQEIFDDPR